MKVVIEFVVTGMMNDQHAAFFQQRLVAIEIEVIAEPHYLDQQRIQNRINVVWRDVRNTGNQNVALAAYRDRILLKPLLNDLCVDRLGFSGLASSPLVLGPPRMQQLASRLPGKLTHRVSHG